MGRRAPIQAAYSAHNNGRRAIFGGSRIASRTSRGDQVPIIPDQRVFLVETMGLEPTTPCLQTRPTRMMANADEPLRLISGAI